MTRIIKPGDRGFYINRNRYIETESEVQVAVEGLFILEAIKPGHGVVRRAEFKNLITNLGLDAMGGTSGPDFRYMHLGTGTATPAATDTALGNFGVNVTGSNPTRSFQAADSSPWYGQRTSVWTSAVGGATGTWTEIGISNQTTNGGLRSRALIVDGGGSPTSFPVLSDEQFQGTYIFRLYSPSADDAESITLSGSPYTATTRALAASTATSGRGNWGPMIGDSVRMFSAQAVGESRLFTGALAAVTAATPAGSSLGAASSATVAAYGSGNYYQDSGLRWGSGEGVGTGRTVMFAASSCGFQIEYNPTFAKGSAQEFIHNQRVSWARR